MSHTRQHDFPRHQDSCLRGQSLSGRTFMGSRPLAPHWLTLGRRGKNRHYVIPQVGPESAGKYYSS